MALEATIAFAACVFFYERQWAVILARLQATDAVLMAIH